MHQDQASPIAGLSRRLQGEGFGNKFLEHISSGLVAHVVRCLPIITHVEGGIDPLRDIDIRGSRDHRKVYYELARNPAARMFAAEEYISAVPRQ